MQVQGIGGNHYLPGAKKTQSALRKTTRQLEKILEKLSTAKRINKAGDDASGLGIAERLTTQIRGFKMASQNISDATAALDIAEGAGREISDLLQRQRELAVAARNETLSADDRKTLDTEYQAITQEINRISEVTNYNRQQIANGSDFGSGSAHIQVGPNAEDAVTVPSMNFQAIVAGLQGTSIASGDSAQAAMASVDTSLDTINSQRSLIGATMNRLSSAGNNLTVAMINTQAAESVIRDEDMAAGLAELTKNAILREGTITAFSRYNDISRNHILGLLQ